MTETNCPCCDKHCPADDLQCGRGTKYFGKAPEGRGEGCRGRRPDRARDQEPLTLEGKLTVQLRVCGHYIYHHGSGRAGQLRILSILSSNGAMGQRELQDILGVRPGSLSEILGKLEFAGLIARSQNPHDKRGMDLAITDAGRETLQGLERQETERQRGMFQVLDQGEQEQLSALLAKLTASWREEPGPGRGGGDHCRHEHGHGHGGRECRRGHEA